MLWLAALTGFMRRLVPATAGALPAFDPYKAKLVNRDVEEHLRDHSRWW